MTLLSKWAFILLGENDTGKTTFQKKLVRYLCGKEYGRLAVNKVIEINYPLASNHFKNISVMNRSFQEKLQDGTQSEYKDMHDFFDNHFWRGGASVDVSILSSHLVCRDIEEMIISCKEKCLNVCGVFFENSLETKHPKLNQILKMDWDERITLPNKLLSGERNEKQIEQQLERAAKQFGDMLIKRSHKW